ncbi:MAG TPA: hypothetical protein VL173_15175 [Vicinamibacterales bacterium]|nr:hypothetical protein [Vicinamibacterales bacterium]
MQAVTPLFDLLAMGSVAATAIAILRVAYLFVRGRWPQGQRTLKHWGIGAAAYCTLAILIGAARPERSIGLGQRWCFDDWCVSVDRVSRRSAATDTLVTLDLEAYNNGGRTQRALYPWMFLRDDQGHRFEPDGTAWIADAEAPVAPHESSRFSVTFHVPMAARELDFVTGHGSGKPCRMVAALLLAGDSRCLFNKYDSIRLY